MAKTELVITLVIEDSSTIQKKGTLSVSRNDLAHIRAFKTTNASDTAYAIDQALRELAELERKEPVKKPAKAKQKTLSSKLNDAPKDEETEVVREVMENEDRDELDETSVELESDSKMPSDELKYDLIAVTGTDLSPVAYKHAALLAEALWSQNLWENATPLTFEDPVGAWNKLQAGTLDLQDVLRLHAGTSTPTMPAYTAAAVPPLTDSISSTLL